MLNNFRLTAGTLTVATAIALAGCGNPVESMVQKGVETAVEKATGAGVDIDVSGKGASLPAGWPDIPTPSGKILASINVEGTLSATFAVDQAEVDRVIAELEQQGYEASSQMEIDKQTVATYSGPEWDLGIIVAQDDEQGMVMIYTVLPSSG